MPRVLGLHFYLGQSPAAKHATPGQNLYMEDDGFLCQRFHNSLLKSQEDPRSFHVGVNIPELPPVDVRWTWAGQTAGVALWERAGRVVAASVYVSGIEFEQEMQATKLVLVAARQPVPPPVFEALTLEPKPVVATIYHDLYSFTDPVIATASPALGNALFALFGANE